MDFVDKSIEKPRGLDCDWDSTELENRSCVCLTSSNAVWRGDFDGLIKKSDASMAKLLEVPNGEVHATFVIAIYVNSRGALRLSCRIERNDRNWDIPDQTDRLPISR